MSEDATLVIRVQNTPEDLAALETYIGGEAEARRAGWKLVAAPAVLVAFVAFVPGPFWLSANFGIAYELGVVAFLFVFAIVAALTWKSWNAVKAPESLDPQSSLWAPQEFTFSLNDVKVIAAHSATELQWAAFRKAVETPSHLFLFIDTRLAYVLPKRELSSEVLASLTALLRTHLKLETR